MTIDKLSLAAGVATLLLIVSGCSSQDAPAKEPAAGESSANGATEEHESEGGPRQVRMDAAAMQSAGIKLARLDAGSVAEKIRAPGEVLDDAYGTTLITPRVEGLVVRRHARLGDEVAAGAPLVTLSSVDVSEAQAQLAVAEQEWQRVESLGTDAVSGRRYAEARITVEQARARARAYGLPGTARGTVSGEFTLTAPQAGRITEDAFVVGERIEPGRTLFRLVDESVVWIDAKLPAETAQNVPAGSAATIVVGDGEIVGKVLRQAHRTSEATRNAIVRIEAANRDDRLHGGDYVDVYLENRGSDGPRLSVPNSALIQLDGAPVVFRQSEPGVLAAVEIRPGAVIGDRTLIAEGLAPGDSVVVEGAFALKAQLLKEQMGEGHGH